MSFLEQQAAKLYFIRKGRFVEGYDPIEELDRLILKYFSDLNRLHKYGLVQAYQELRKAVIKDNLIGLIFIGADLSSDNNRIYHKYELTTQKGATINLSRHSICTSLLKEHIDEAVREPESTRHGS